MVVSHGEGESFGLAICSYVDVEVEDTAYFYSRHLREEGRERRLSCIVQDLLVAVVQVRPTGA